MSRTAKLSTALITIALATMTLAGCTATTAPEATEPSPKASPAAAAAETESTPKATPKDTPAPTPTATCPTARIGLPTSDNGQPVEGAELLGEIIDTGVREYAVGEPTLNADGQITSYIVQPGDALDAIVTRFCFHKISLVKYNKVTHWAMQPGDVLVLRPDPSIPWAPETDEERAAVSCNAGYKNGIDMDSKPPRVKGLITDFGATTGANGTVSRDANNEIETYTVAAGDNLTAVADRFCFDADELAAYNETGPTIDVGQVLVLRPPFGH